MFKRGRRWEGLELAGIIKNPSVSATVCSGDGERRNHCQRVAVEAASGGEVQVSEIWGEQDKKRMKLVLIVLEVE